jgi:hypothetical protein
MHSIHQIFDKVFDACLKLVHSKLPNSKFKFAKEFEINAENARTKEDCQY